MPTYLCIIIFLAYLFLMGSFLGCLMDKTNSGFAIFLFLVLFIVGWFVVIGICSKDENESVKNGIIGGIEFLKTWLFYIVFSIGLAIALIIFGCMGKF